MLSDIHLRGKLKTSDVPMEFVKQARCNLEAAEQLLSLMSECRWQSNYYRGQAILLLTFYSVELFLKGAILRLNPTAKIKGHSLARLTKLFRGLAPGFVFEPPFTVDPLPPYPELARRAECQNAQFHEVFRYPVDSDGNLWPGVRGFSASSCRRLLERVRTDCERLYDRAFHPAG